MFSTGDKPDSSTHWRALEERHIKTVGAGRTLAEASAPALLDIPGKGRVAVLAFGCATSGVPGDWAATRTTPGVSFLSDLSGRSAQRVVDQIGRAREQFDIAVVSLHWGSNWGYDIAEDQRAFAHSLIDNAGVSIVYGHSSHHPRGIEVYRGRLILYGCGDFLNDYEGIRGHEDYRGDLALMYFVDLMPDGSLAGVELVPLRIRRFQLTDPTREETEWVQRTLDRESAKFGTHVRLKPDGRLELTW